MKLIAHRGNIDGPSDDQNDPDYIDNALSLGYDAEIDVRYDPLTTVFWLGHDEPQYKVSWKWMANRAELIWIHCKDITTLHEFTKYEHAGYKYFWHDQDDHTLTSNKYIWTSMKLTGLHACTYYTVFACIHFCYAILFK